MGLLQALTANEQGASMAAVVGMGNRGFKVVFGDRGGGKVGSVYEGDSEKYGDNIMSDTEWG